MSTNEVQPHPVFADQLVALADRLIRSGQRETAAELLEMAASLTPHGEEYREKAAILRENPEDAEDAERDHKRHNLEASHSVGMARVFESRGELGRAQEMFDLGKLRAPFHYLAYAGAGYLYLRQRDLRAALEEFGQARRLNPLDRKLAVECARIALELEEYQEALHHAVDVLHLSQGVSEGELAAASRRVDTLVSLCRMDRELLTEIHQQRAAALQRACEQVALTRARLFTSLSVSDGRRATQAKRAAQDYLLRVAMELRRFRALRHFSDAQLVQLTQIGRQERFRHAQVLTREDMDDRDVFILLEGKLQVHRNSPIGSQNLASLLAGEISGEVSFIDGNPRSGSLLGVEAGTVLRLPAGELEDLSRTHHELGVALLWAFWHSLASKIRAANDMMSELVAPGASSDRPAAAKPGERVFLDPSVKVGLLREQGLSAGELRLLATYSHEERFSPETLIFSEGEEGDALYIVVEGEVRIARRFDTMGEETLAVLGRGEVFGEMALIHDKPRSADARAHSSGCTVFTLDRARLEEVLEMDPDAARQFLNLMCHLLCRRVRAINDRLVAWRVMATHE